MSVTPFASRVLSWYAVNRRTLPWRGQATPYAVWISEVMLQQTRVDTVVPYFSRWMKALPSIRALAAAPERRVLKLWEGLGYYSRARTLRKAAKILVDEHHGQLPSDLNSLILLPGIGRYTAGAVSSIAFGRDVATLDGNIRRVLARVFKMRAVANSRAGEKTLLDLAEKNLPKGRAGDFNQAVMELGALVCVPKEPRCGVCPVRAICRAHRSGDEKRLPVLRRGKRIPRYEAGAAVIRQGGRVLLAHRPPRGLLGGMWEFPNARLAGPRRPRDRRIPGLSEGLHAAYGIRVRRGPLVAKINHAYTHFRISVSAYDCKLTSATIDPPLSWVRVRELAHYPMGRVDRHIALHLDT